jgi:hypothetical protein
LNVPSPPAVQNGFDEHIVRADSLAHAPAVAITSRAASGNRSAGICGARTESDTWSFESSWIVYTLTLFINSVALRKLYILTVSVSAPL